MKRIRLISIMVAVALLGGLAIAIYRGREPRYQGRALTDWIADGDSAYFKFIDHHRDGDFRLLASDPAWLTASRAVKQMAPDAIPLLLKWVQEEDSTLKWKVAVWFDAHPSFHIHIRTGRERNGIALTGFMLLGNEAKPAWPALIHLTFAPTPERRIWALDCLFESNSDKEILLPVLRRLLHDPDHDVNEVAASTFHRRFPQDAEAAGVYKMFPGVKDELIEQTGTNQSPAK